MERKPSRYQTVFSEGVMLTKSYDMYYDKVVYRMHPRLHGQAGSDYGLLAELPRVWLTIAAASSSPTVSSASL